MSQTGHTNEDSMLLEYETVSLGNQFLSIVPSTQGSISPRGLTQNAPVFIRKIRFVEGIRNSFFDACITSVFHIHHKTVFRNLDVNEV